MNKEQIRSGKLDREDSIGFYKPENWNDGKRMVEQLGRMKRDVEIQQFHSRPSEAVKKYQKGIEYEMNQMFYVGFLFGMAAEAHKEHSLMERNVDPTL